jgi:energy-converting hydrogenase Eha subunit C
MNIWLPERIYRAVPVVCIFLGVFFLVTAPRPMSAMLSIALIGYGSVILLSRRGWSSVTAIS